MSNDEDKAKEMQVLCRLITWFDGYANLSCVDPLKVERAMKFCGEDVQGVWGRIKRDVYDIVKLPGESERVVRLVKVVNVSRFFFFGFAVLSIILFILASLIAPRLFSNSSTSLAVLVVIAVVFNADVIVYFYSTRKLSSVVREFFEGSKDKAKPQRRRMKEAAQALIDKLASRVRSAGAEPEGYRFALLDPNYSNVRVTREKGAITAIVSTGTR